MQFATQTGEFRLVGGRRIRWRYDRVLGAAGSAWVAGGRSEGQREAWLRALSAAGLSCFSFEPAATAEEVVEIYAQAAAIVARFGVGAHPAGGRWVVLGLDERISPFISERYYEFYSACPPVACVLTSPWGASERDLGKITCPFLIVDRVADRAGDRLGGNAPHERAITHHVKRYGDTTRLIRSQAVLAESFVIEAALQWLMPLSKHLRRPNVSRALAMAA